jgi:hypothetical protein
VLCEAFVVVFLGGQSDHDEGQQRYNVELPPFHRYMVLHAQEYFTTWSERQPALVSRRRSREVNSVSLIGCFFVEK